MASVVHDSIDDERQLQRLLARHLNAQAARLDVDIQFSWTRAAFCVVSYALLLSDVFRSGLGIRRDPLPRIAPDEVVMFGPFAYSVLHAQRNDTTHVHRVWPYKFDTTSVSMRALAEMLRLATTTNASTPTWPPCLFYKAPCVNGSLPVTTIFHMLDELVDTVATRRNGATHELTMRVQSTYVDRAHHFILPQFFRDRMTRTSHTVYLDSSSSHDLAAHDTPVAFCAPDHAQLYACARYSTRFALLGSETTTRARIGRVWHAAATRKQLLQQWYSTDNSSSSSHTVALDILVIESQVDYSKPRVSYQGRQFSDTVVLTRVRHCRRPSNDTINTLSTTTQPPFLQPQTVCETVAVDDFRVETGMITSTVVRWFPIVATLRTIGQAYMYLRVLLLFVGCYCYNCAMMQPPRTHNAPRSHRYTHLVAAMRTFLLVPSQSVVYGSLLPIACYVVAHLLDSEATYSFVSESFGTTLGAFELNVVQFIQLSAVSMRSVWEVALVLHAVVAVATRSRRAWSRRVGVPGVREFAVNVVASSTVVAQLRAVAFRDARVESVVRIPNSQRLATLYGSMFRPASVVALGNALDVKCLVVATLALVVVAVGVRVAQAALQLMTRRQPRNSVRLSLCARTCVSFAGGTLWPTTALVVSWHDDVVAVQQTPTKQQQRRVLQSMLATRTTTQVAPAPIAVVPLAAAAATTKRSSEPPLVHEPLDPQTVFPSCNALSREQLEQSLCIPDARRREATSLLVLMNIAAMTDPLVLWHLWGYGSKGEAIDVFESRVTQRVFLIPHAAAAAVSEWDDNDAVNWLRDYRLLQTVNTKRLHWHELLHCG